MSLNQDVFSEMLNRIPTRLSGDWIKQNSSYEVGLCAEIGWTPDENRYFDARYEGMNIEIKKGNSIWLDLVRYSEITLGIGYKDTITSFFIPSKDKMFIDKILFVMTDKIIELLKIDIPLATILVNLNNRMPRSLNCQASLTVHDVSKIAFYIKTF